MKHSQPPHKRPLAKTRCRVHNVLRLGRLGIRDLRNGRVLSRAKYQHNRHRALQQLLIATTRFLDSISVDYWLQDGTLLGYTREKGIMLHDTDNDLGLPEEEFARVWSSRHLLPAGFTMYDTTLNHFGRKLYIQHGGWESDLFFHRRNGSHFHPYEKSHNPGSLVPFPVSHIYPLQRVDFLGVPMNIPARTIELLEHVYGYIGPDAVRSRRTGYWIKAGTE